MVLQQGETSDTKHIITILCDKSHTRACISAIDNPQKADDRGTEAAVLKHGRRSEGLPRVFQSEREAMGKAWRCKVAWSMLGGQMAWLLLHPAGCRVGGIR